MAVEFLLVDQRKFRTGFTFDKIIAVNEYGDNIITKVNRRGIYVEIFQTMPPRVEKHNSGIIADYR